MSVDGKRFCNRFEQIYQALLEHALQLAWIRDMLARRTQSRLLQKMTGRRHADVTRQQHGLQLLVQRIVDLAMSPEQRRQLATKPVACGGKSGFQAREPAARSGGGIPVRRSCLVGSTETQHTEGC